MLSLHLQPIFKARGIEKPFSFLVKAGFNYNTAHRLIKGIPSVFRLDHIEQLCKVLVCEPNDLLVWAPNKNEMMTENHPLRALQRTDNDNNIKELLSTTPLKELKSFTDNLSNLS